MQPCLSEFDSHRRLFFVFGVCRIARDFAKVEDQVRLLARTLDDGFRGMVARALLPSIHHEAPASTKGRQRINHLTSSHPLGIKAG